MVSGLVSFPSVQSCDRGSLNRPLSACCILHTMELSNLPSRLLRIASAPRRITNPHLNSWHCVEPVLVVLAHDRTQFRHVILVESLATDEPLLWLFQRIASALAPPQHPLLVLFITCLNTPVASPAQCPYRRCTCSSTCLWASSP